MYVLVDLTVNDAAVEPWLASLRDDVGAPLRVQRFPGIGSAALDVTPAQFEEGRRLKLDIRAVQSMRIPSIEMSGDPVRIDRLPVGSLWSQELIGSSAFTATGRGVKVGHIDTGIDATHPLLHGRPADFAAFRQNGTWVEISKPAEPYDGSGHGTATASLIGGKAPLGLAPSVSLYSAALDGPPWTDAMLEAAVGWIIEQDVRVAWLGVERPNEFCPAHEALVTKLLNKNILPVTAVGNVGAGTSSSPGNCRDGLSTGAVGDGGPSPILWDRSCSQIRPDDQLKPDVVAPGHEVLVAYCYYRPSSVEFQVVPFSGTSLAGPHVVALAALCLELRSTLTAPELVQGISGGCRLFTLDPKRAHHGVPWGPSIKGVLRL